tara:strand:- start:29 stop:541 length:513 start_codon:yes stop_codon:yes gene_type:complete
LIDYKKIFLEILNEQAGNNKWDEALFEKIVLIPITNRGQVGQNFVEKICEKSDLSYTKPEGTQSPWDIKIKNISFEIKAATEDTSGNFQFNHIRYHRNYDALLCIGISPNEIFFASWTAADVKTNKAGNLVTMEKGANASFKLTKKKSDLFSFDLFKNKIEEIISKVSNS